MLIRKIFWKYYIVKHPESYRELIRICDDYYELFVRLAAENVASTAKAVRLVEKIIDECLDTEKVCTLLELDYEDKVQLLYRIIEKVAMTPG